MRKIFIVLLMSLVYAIIISPSNAFAAISDGDFLELCKSGTVQEVEAAIKNGANVNAEDEDGWTALMIAATNNSNPEIISVLLKNDADASLRDVYGVNAADYASENDNLKNTEIFQQLLAASHVEPE